MHDLSTFFTLLAGHFVCDFPLQSRHILEDKQTAGRTLLGTLTLIGHCATHALVIGLLAALLGLPNVYGIALVIAVSHFAIDLGKIRGFYGLATDQTLHYLVIALIALI